MPDGQQQDDQTRHERPDWFSKALEHKPESHTVDVEGCPIHYATWGDPAKPGLLLVPGATAHTHWFDFIAPLLTDHFQIAAVDFSGMGNSGHREAYANRLFSQELLDVLEDTGMLNRDIRPIVMGHSMGGGITAELAHAHGERLLGVILCDVARYNPEELTEGSKQRATPPPTTKKFYPSREATLARYRLAPPQPTINPYILDYLGPLSIHEEPEGWTWKFDANVFGKRLPDDNMRTQQGFGGLACRSTFIYGEKSIHAGPETLNIVREEAGTDAPIIRIPEAYHHVFLDQPLAFVGALEAIATIWLTDERRTRMKS